MKTLTIPGLATPADLYNFDISSFERAAFQRGDTALADILGRLMEVEAGVDDERKACEEEAYDQRLRADRILSNVDDAIQQLEQIEEPKGRPTISQFKAIMAKLEETTEYLRQLASREAE